MILESGQMLSTAHRLLDGIEESRPSKSGKSVSRYWKLSDAREETLYKAVHMHHPCTIWSMQSNNNYNWHWTHFNALCKEYTYRYGKTHKTDENLRLLLKNLPSNISIGNLHPLPLAMGAAPECINYNDRVGSYRNFYKTKKDRFKMVWSKRKVPDWFQTI